MIHPTYVPNPDLDLVLERVVESPPELVWEAWTRPEHLKKWFAPAPWSIADVQIDLRPGGTFHTVLRSPEGEDHPSTGCFLEIVEHRRLVFTDALEPGHRPSAEPFFTAAVTFEPHEKGTRYVARAIHSSAEKCREHEEMGFHEGWGAAFEQMVDLVRELQSG